MKLIEALNLLKHPAAAGASPMNVWLACGFTPLHLSTFLAAALRQRCPGHVVTVETGLYDDLSGNIDRTPSECAALVAVLEWEDLDPRLGFRRLGGWSPGALPDIVHTTQAAASRLAGSLLNAAKSLPVIACLPTLPLPPVFFTPPERESSAESQLHEIVANLAIQLQPDVRIASRQRLDELSPANARLDLSATLSSGFPYTLTHASALGELLAECVAPRPAKKGLITDLDGTLWSGILGDDGVEAIAWDLDHNAQIHGLYQQMLASLSAAGILVAVASKNDSALVERAFARPDLHIQRDSIYPFEVHWARKSESVARILEAWNIAPDAAIFVDDSSAAAAEVQAAFPEMECIVFPRFDPRAFLAFLKRLREAFGKPAVTSEDTLRLASLRNSGAWRGAEKTAGALSEYFLASLNATVTFTDIAPGEDARAFDLLNKTNQFNLNGRRLPESEWRALLTAPGGVAISVSYTDRFGPLGTIAVILGRREGARLRLLHWVMSCRALSRRIEHRSIQFLFDDFGLEDIVFDYQRTERNRPLSLFLAELTGQAPTDCLRLTRGTLTSRMPALYHQVEREAHEPK